MVMVVTYIKNPGSVVVFYDSMVFLIPIIKTLHSQSKP